MQIREWGSASRAGPLVPDSSLGPPPLLRELPCSVPIPGAVGARPCCCRIGSGMEQVYGCGSAVGARSHTATQGAMVEGGCCRAGAKVWGGQAVASPQRQQCPPGCHGHRRWSRQSSPRGAQGTWRWSFAVTRAVSIPENRPTAAPCCRSCDLAPSAKGAGGRREQPDGHHDTQAGLCLPQWALAFGALSRITLLWVM